VIKAVLPFNGFVFMRPVATADLLLRSLAERGV